MSTFSSGCNMLIYKQLETRGYALSSLTIDIMVLNYHATGIHIPGKTFHVFDQFLTENYTY